MNDDGNVNQNDLAQWLAQWAINVIDFYDSDSIMTPFEYDINPFNDDPGNPSTTVDGNPKTDDGSHRGLVFGCERPELLITESFTYHDRRSEDLDNDDGEEETPGGHDPDDDLISDSAGWWNDAGALESQQQPNRTPNDLY